MKPWHDCPRCVCGGPLVGYGLRDQTKRLRCCACGDEVVGSDDEVARAKRADTAWESHLVALGYPSWLAKEPTR